MIQDGETGFLAAAPSAGALAARIRSVLTMEPDAMAAVIEHARAVWAERYTMDRYQREVIEALERSLAGMSVRNSRAAAVASPADAISTNG